MRRRRKTSQQPGISLFPFLAVLICTLGVLIVLLVIAVQSAVVGKAEHESVVARQIDEAEEQKATQASVLEQLEDQIDAESFRAEGLTSARTKTNDQLKSARDYRTFLEKEIRTLEEQAQQLAADITVFDADRKEASEELDQSEIDELKKKIADADFRLLEKRNSIITVSEKKYSIVPYRGAGGTKRVPVFIECDADGLILQPWNIRLTKNDFAHPVGAGNPVDAALIVVRNYFEKYRLGESDQRPYPLLVVRPEGAQSYGLARRSLSSWDDEFGYELVTSEKELDFGSVDPQLEDEIRDAVEKSKQMQRSLAKRQFQLANARGRFGVNGPQRAGGSFGQGLRASSQKGGFVREGGPREGGPRPGSRNGRWSGNESANDQQASFERGKQGTNRNQADRIASSDSRRTSASKSAGPNRAVRNGPDGNAANGSPFASDEPQSLANKRGANWALPTETAGATGYVRTVSVICGAEGLRIRDVNGQEKTIDFGNDTAGAIDQMVNIIWQRIDSWGIAGANAYWKPGLQVTVAEGGRVRFETIRKLLSGSGLDIEEASK